MVAEKNSFQMHKTILQRIKCKNVISKCKNDKPWKNQIGKVPVPF